MRKWPASIQTVCIGVSLEGHSIDKETVKGQFQLGSIAVFIWDTYNVSAQDPVFLKLFQLSDRIKCIEIQWIGMETPFKSICFINCISTLTVQNIINTFLILSPLLSSEQLQFVGAWTTRCQAFHRVASPCWFQCFPQLCQVGWMSYGWWTILDTHGKLLSMKNPAALQFLTHSNQCAWHLLPYPVQKALQTFAMPISPSEWHTYTIHVSIVSRLKNPSLILPFIYTDWSGFNKWHQ